MEITVTWHDGKYPSFNVAVATKAGNDPFIEVKGCREERKGRVTRLQEIMPRADVTISEKYRRILEAYQIELDYGRSLDTYQGKLPGEGEEKTVDFVRLGRVSLMYQTPDGNETGYWNQNSRKWVIDDGYKTAVQKAIKVAKKMGAPDLLEVPVPAPKSEVQS